MNATRLSLALMLLPGSLAFGSELHGSHASMVRQHRIAVEEDFTFVRTAKQLHDLVHDNRLEQVSSTNDLAVSSEVSYPYTRPTVKLFIERLAAEYHEATGERLVVTSLTRPESEQPRNASPLSVHPAGMAVDLRVPDTQQKRHWLEQTLLSLEDKGLLDVTRELHPSHYHVAVFPEQYDAYAKTLPPIAVTESAEAKPVPAVTHASVMDDAGSSGHGSMLLSVAICALAVMTGRLISRREEVSGSA